MALRTVAKGVFRCFRRFEKCADRVTGHVGPVFIGLGSILIVICAFTFFNVIFPVRFLTDDTHPVTALMALLFCGYMCTCVVLHYRLACTTPPGTPSDPIPALEDSGSSSTYRQHQHHPLSEHTSTPDLLVNHGDDTVVSGPTPSRSSRPGNGEDRLQGQGRPSSLEHNQCSKRKTATQVCMKCWNERRGRSTPQDRSALSGRAPSPPPPPKPERAHHCRTCRTCILKYDHHCPWINNCVGLANERYFVLFLWYLPVSCFLVTLWGWPSLLLSLSARQDWNYYAPPEFVMLTWLLTAVIGFAVGVMGLMAAWQIYKAETTVEQSDNDYYRRLCKSRGKVFVNPYDLGPQLNFAQFFCVRPFSRRRWWSVLIPTRVSPAGDGWTWEKRAGWESNGVSHAEQLTDEEDESE